MSEHYDPDTDPSVPPRDAPPRGGKAKAVPPLAWIILGLLLLFAVIALSQCDAIRRTPGGDTIPQTNLEDPVEAVMPATPPPVTNTPVTNSPAP
jgi:hypothetical protein